MKLVKVILWLFAAVLVYELLGGWTTVDYSLHCTKCMASKRVVEQRVIDIPVFRRTSENQTAGDYERIFGHPCEHVFRRGGSGRQYHFLFWKTAIACGVSGDRVNLQPRMIAVSAAYGAELRLHDRQLTLATFEFIDSLMPPDAQIRSHRDLRREKWNTLYQLGSYLSRAKTVDQWRTVLDAARQDFADTSNLPAE